MRFVNGWNLCLIALGLLVCAANASARDISASIVGNEHPVCSDVK